MDQRPQMRSMTMASSIIFFFSLIFFNLLGVSISMENCTTPSCNSAASFSVSFPFRLPQYQSNVQCGYSSDFTLSCSTDGKNSLLHLPNTSSFAIDTIDYFLQKVTVTDPNGCLPQRFLELDLSTSPFSFYLGAQTYTYYNCSQTVLSGSLFLLSTSNEVMTCMSDEDYSVIAQWDDGPNPSTLLRDNCTVIKSSVSAPLELIYSYPKMSVAVLHWSEPQCGGCEVCGFKDGSNTAIECQENDTPGSPWGDYDPESKSKSKSKKKSAGLALGLGIPGGVLTMIAAVVAAYIFASKRRVKHMQSNLPETQLTLPEPMTTLSIS